MIKTAYSRNISTILGRLCLYRSAYIDTGIIVLMLVHLCSLGVVLIPLPCGIILELDVSMSCPMYALLQLGQVSLYTPDSEYLSGAGCLWASKFPIVFLVRNATFSSVFLNRFVM